MAIVPVEIPDAELTRVRTAASRFTGLPVGEPAKVLAAGVLNQMVLQTERAVKHAEAQATVIGSPGIT